MFFWFFYNLMQWLCDAGPIGSHIQSALLPVFDFLYAAFNIPLG